MANKERMFNGPQPQGTLFLKVPVADATAFEKGDFVALASNLGIKVSSVADAGDAAANRAAGAAVFIGVALDAKVANDGATHIMVAANGLMWLDQKTAAAIGFGDEVEIYASDAACEVQTIVAGSTSAIGICMETHDDTVTETLVLIQPALANV